MVLERLSEIAIYQKKLKRLLNDNILDIILFGSFVKGGFAKDIDIAIVIKNKSNLNEIKNKIKEIIKEKTDIQIIDIESIYSPLWLTLIKEGFSINNNKFLFQIYNIKPMVLYKYSLKRLSNVQKVQFERGIKKVLGDKGEYLARSVILAPIELKNRFMDFLKTWNIYYESQEYELLPIVRGEELV
ncbi:nucleotidyltransferase domain-containing protein [Candidatus Woesearchaeota archaeon]|nr:nucleotidyltransferase domain-containing protein [Candidatus Woesearchaeota archaeon]